MKLFIKIVGVCIGIVALYFICTYTFVTLKSWKPWSLPLSGQVIVLDAGHGGIDGGTSSGNIMEKDITLHIAKKTQDYLQEQGAVVLLTRDGDYDLSSNHTKSIARRKAEDLQARVNLINDAQANFFVSIHLNSFPSSSSKGAQTFYYGANVQNRKAANFVQDEMKKSLENTTRVAKQIQHVYLLKHVKVPGVLVEVGFLSHPRERELLVTESYQNKVAEALYRGILRYYTGNKK